MAVAKMDKENQRIRGLGNDCAVFWYLCVHNKKIAERQRNFNETLAEFTCFLQSEFLDSKALVNYI